MEVVVPCGGGGSMWRCGPLRPPLDNLLPGRDAIPPHTEKPAVSQTDEHGSKAPRYRFRFTTVVGLKALAQATHKCLIVFIINISAVKVIAR